MKLKECQMECELIHSYGMDLNGLTSSVLFQRESNPSEPHIMIPKIIQLINNLHEMQRQVYSTQLPYLANANTFIYKFTVNRNECERVIFSKFKGFRQRAANILRKN